MARSVSPPSELPATPVSEADPPKLTRRGRALRAGRRLLALGAFAVAGVAAFQFVISPVLPERAASPGPAAEAAPPADPASAARRPASVPQQIPAWAWELHTWHERPAAERGPRPAGAPARVPGWYWEWREWRLELSRLGP